MLALPTLLAEFFSEVGYAINLVTTENEGASLLEELKNESSYRRMDQEEHNKESRYQFVAHFTIIVVVLDSPEEIADHSTYHRQREVSQSIDVESL